MPYLRGLRFFSLNLGGLALLTIFVLLWLFSFYYYYCSFFFFFCSFSFRQRGRGERQGMTRGGSGWAGLARQFINVFHIIISTQTLPGAYGTLHAFSCIATKPLVSRICPIFVQGTLKKRNTNPGSILSVWVGMGAWCWELGGYRGSEVAWDGWNWWMDG